MAEDKYLELLLTHKFSTLDLMANTSMLWWVSSIVFCATIIATVYTHRAELCKLPHIHWVCLLITLFFLTFPAYGCWIIYSSQQIQSELMVLLKEVKRDAVGLHEFKVLRVGLCFGMINFILIFCAWGWLWYLIGKERGNGSR